MIEEYGKGSTRSPSIQISRTLAPALKHLLNFGRGSELEEFTVDADHCFFGFKVCGMDHIVNTYGDLSKWHASVDVFFDRLAQDGYFYTDEQQNELFQLIQSIETDLKV